MDAELRIGAMGFEEGYVSRVEAEKERWVKVKWHPSPSARPLLVAASLFP
jgi:ribosome-associated toxin RatA of RatAB toxin-antitoxin module